MAPLPPVAPTIGTRIRIRLGREYYIRFQTCDYSVDPRVIGSLVDVYADLERVQVRCRGRLVADHPRCWARRQVITDPAHVATAAQMRAAYQQIPATSVRAHADGHEVQMRALPDYDELFGIDFPAPAARKAQS